MKIYRGWINQPSSLQALHAWHGEKVIVVSDEKESSCVTVYFTQGDVFSIRVLKYCVSPCKEEINK